MNACRLPVLLATLAILVAVAASPAAQAAEPQAAATAASAAPASRLDEILARGVLRVGSTGDYKPFSYRAASAMSSPMKLPDGPVRALNGL